MNAEAVITLRYDEGNDTFVLSADIPNARTYESVGRQLSAVFQGIAEDLENDNL